MWELYRVCSKGGLERWYFTGYAAAESVRWVFSRECNRGGREGRYFIKIVTGEGVRIGHLQGMVGYFTGYMYVAAEGVRMGALQGL